MKFLYPYFLSLCQTHICVSCNQILWNQEIKNHVLNMKDFFKLEISFTRHMSSSVTHGWFSAIPSFITRGSTLWHSLVFNQICMTSVTSSSPMKLRVMYACCSSVSGSPSKFCSDEIWLVYMVHAYF